MTNSQNYILDRMMSEIHNPVFENAVNMYRQGNAQGVEMVARNICAQKGIDPDSAINSIRNQYGIK